eukprot:TRINITY_DN238_c0_g3_i1.p1 TRINITY_DN238_c0_g3~~TRINITY_DN238_c0_g3_i1.p1  ORF type:complete len:578 (+),score=202.93 TRINITY_DN238_c0_g3_i1:88-1821(+)
MRPQKTVLTAAVQHTSSAASAANGRPAVKKIVDFTDSKSAYKSKSNLELLRAIIVFKLCTVRPLVNNANSLIKFSESVLGKKLTHQVIVKRTFFNHFCAGEDVDEIQSTLANFSAIGVGAILDYAAENDVPEEEDVAIAAPVVERLDADLVTRQRDDVHSARIYDYQGEKECDHNLETVLECIEHASRNTKGGQAFCAVKLTALCKPALLERMSAILMATRKTWVEGFSDAQIEKATPLEEYRSIVSCPTITKSVTLEQWKAGLKKICKNPVSDAEAENMFEAVCGDDHLVDYLDYTRLLTFEALSIEFEDGEHPKHINHLRPLTQSGALPLLNIEETRLLRKLVERVNRFAKAAVEHKVNVMIDAEQTYLQVAIDHFTILLQRIYNMEDPRIYNTYQCYLTFMESRIRNDLERSKREGWKFAGKLVRGAYMVQEREIATKKNHASPILPNAQATHVNYDKCVEMIMNEMPDRHVGLMIGSHNQASIERVLEVMETRGIDKRTGGVYFGQLMGMADQLTFPLGQNGYNVYKYVPYGPVHEVMPYLIRRAQENSSMTSLADMELGMLINEFKRRVHLA